MVSVFTPSLPADATSSDPRAATWSMAACPAQRPVQLPCPGGSGEDTHSAEARERGGSAGPTCSDLE